MVRRLDALMNGMASRHDLKRVYLKTDTQGHDLEVIGGLGSQIACVVALQLEIPIIEIYKGMAPMSEIIQALSADGFALSGLFRLAGTKLCASSSWTVSL